MSSDINILPASLYSLEQVSLIPFYISDYESVLDKGDTSGLPEFVVDFLAHISGDKAISKSVLEKAKTEAEKLKKAPHMHMITALPPTEDFKRKTIKWARRNITENTLISFYSDTSIAGGFILRARGRIFDFSFRKKLQNPEKKFTTILKDA